MPKIYKRNCDFCNKYYERSNAKRYCSTSCSIKGHWKEGVYKNRPPIWNKGIKGFHFSLATEFKKGSSGFIGKHSQSTKEKISKANKGKRTGTNSHNWKGNKVSYRSLHQWVRRYKGNPITCSHCGISHNNPKKMNWANIDGKYRRKLIDFISLCSSCHKIHDKKLSY